MQVTHVQDHVTHAVINSAAPITFGISESAEFFQILSSNLYSDQILAVVRETLCNAWDAHIEAGCTDTPVKVTIDSEKLTIRDFGNGIHYDQMGPLYGTYGGTNKRNDGRQTGGFGLGCKAPFAYADHFEVESHHQGTRTLYAISKSSAELQGKPGIVPIVSFPTTETGLEVGILLKQGDCAKFRIYLERIARNGEMNVEINDKLIDVLPISKGESNWFITREYPTGKSEDKILVRYGNVIYPVQDNSAYQNGYKRITQFLEKIGDYSIRYSIIFQAPPHSISVTPSRESLSMQEHTINTLVGLLGDFVLILDTELHTQFEVIVDKQIAKAVAEKNIGALLTDEEKVPGLQRTNFVHIQTIEQLARTFIALNYPNSHTFHAAHLGKRLEATINLGVGKKGHLRDIQRAITTTKLPERVTEYRTANAWYKHHIVRPLVRDLQADTVMDPTRLHVNSFNHHNINVMPVFYNYVGHGFRDYIKLQRNIVILTYSKKDIGTRASLFPELKKLGSTQYTYVYHAPVAKTKVQAMRDFFVKRGFILLDLTTPQPWDPPKIKKEPADPTIMKKVKPAGYPALSGAIVHTGHSDRIDNCFLEYAPRITEPKCYLFATASRASYRPLEFGNFRGAAGRAVVKLVGSECAVVTTAVQQDKLLKEGLPTLEDYVTNLVINEVTTSPQFTAYWPDSVDRAMGELSGNAHYGISDKIFGSEPIRASLGLTSHLDTRGKNILTLWRSMVDRAPYVDVKVKDAMKLVTDFPVSQPAIDLAKNYKASVLMEVLSTSKIEQLLKSSTTPQSQIDKICQMILLALKG